MPRRIFVLPEKLANQIAAGEVVERPASVVKELVENALDAAAARIDVVIRNGGKTEIRVADDGHGMGREDALLAIDRHATSKIRDAADLAAIRTLGFRGEALPSVASVSRSVIETAERDGDGTRVTVTGGNIVAVDPVARRPGTTVSVRSLFFNVPARAKFLRSAAAEARAVAETLITTALAHHTIVFTLVSNERELLDLGVATQLGERIAAIWGSETAGDLIPVSARAGSLATDGMVQRPHRVRATGRRAYLFVNGRPFVDRALVRAVDRAYRTTIPERSYPSFFLFLHVPDADVDVNVHPAKAEVRFRDRGAVEALLEDAVRNALAGFASTPTLAGAGAGSPVSVRIEPAAARTPHDGAAAATSRADEAQMTLFVPGAPAPTAAPIPTPAPSAADLLGPAPAMWQVHNTYIVAETRDGLILVDQHSAHERVLYEALLHDFDTGQRPSQRLLFPLTLRLSPPEFARAEELRGVLERIGFEMEPFGGRTIIVHGVPNPHPHFDAERCLREMIAELTEGSALIDGARTQHERAALSFACKAAIKAGQKLSAREMSELFDRLFATELPFHDIHGRPTVVQLPLSELHRRFGRGA